MPSSLSPPCHNFILTSRMIALNVPRLINETATVDGILSGLHFMIFSTHVRKFVDCGKFIVELNNSF